MFVADLFESFNSRTVVIMAGGFHPWTPGHSALYQAAVKAFPEADVWVAATNDTRARPFPFDVKKQLATIAGIPADRFVQVKSPFKPDEITSHYDPATTSLIFVRSEKDQADIKLGGTKKDGTLSFLQPYNPKNIAPLSKHGYMAFLPTVQYKVGASGVTGATQIRSAWSTATQKQKTQIVKDLYPRVVTSPSLVNKVVNLLNSTLSSQVKEDWGTHKEYHSKRLGTKDGLPYEYSSMRYHPNDIPRHWNKDDTIRKWKDEDQSNANLKSLYRVNEDPSNNSSDALILIPGFGQIRMSQAINEIDKLSAELRGYVQNGQVNAASEYIKKMQPFVDAVKKFKVKK